MDDWVNSSSDDDDDGLSIQPFEPSKECLRRIVTSCPNMAKLSLLVRDHTLAQIAKEFKTLPSKVLRLININNNISIMNYHCCS